MNPKLSSISVIMLALIGVLYTATPLFAIASVDFTKVVEEHSMLLLLFAGVVIGGLATIIKLLYDKMGDKIKITEAEHKAAEEKLHVREYEQLKMEFKFASEKVMQLEGACNQCQKTLPFTYVSKMDFERFAEMHREDITNIAQRFESLIKEFKADMKEDMAEQIERIIHLLDKKLK